MRNALLEADPNARMATVVYDVIRCVRRHPGIGLTDVPRTLVRGDGATLVLQALLYAVDHGLLCVTQPSVDRPDLALYTPEAMAQRAPASPHQRKG